MAFFNFPEKYATAPAGSALPGPLTALKCFQAICGEGDLDDIIPTKNKFTGTSAEELGFGGGSGSAPRDESQ